MTTRDTPLRVNAIPVRQWLRQWNDVDFDADAHRRRPERQFYIFTLQANLLRRLTGIARRSAAEGRRRHLDLGIQRRHEKARSQLIGEFVRYGYPWSELDPSARDDPANKLLQKPGWLATAIVVNAIAPGEQRPLGEMTDADAVTIEDGGPCGAVVHLPKGIREDSWAPPVPPLEVIDGQHRLWAFDDTKVGSSYELPVVAFRGLDRSWQAYLFWVINIKPKRINPSLAFDLYPLLRAEDWLDRPAELDVYRKVRAQELVEALWSFPESPWHRRINMLGETGAGPMVSQSAWVHSLTATFVKSWQGKGVRVGGLYGGYVGTARVELAWNRSQQAAYLIAVWQALREAIGDESPAWARLIRREQDQGGHDPAFYGPHTLVSTDQGVRGVLAVANDLSYLHADELRLRTWVFEPESDEDAIQDDVLKEALESLRRHRAHEFLEEMARALADFDWRRASAPGLSEQQQLEKSALRGSGGYRLLRLLLLRHAARKHRGRVARFARAALEQID